jgi:nitrogen regulatory protein PII
MKVQVVINLHETEFLEETLTALAEAGVLDCVVREAEGVPSHHAGGQLEPAVLGSIANLFKRDRNMNYMIMAVAEEADMDRITDRLKRLWKQDRYAASFWFLPIHSYFYHKAEA